MAPLNHRKLSLAEPSETVETAATAVGGTRFAFGS